jgi:hypothetical protein
VATVVVPVGVEPLAEPWPCAQTGALTSDVLVLTATRTPRWIWLLLFFGVWPYLIAAYFTRVSAKVAVPFTNEAWHRYLKKWKFARNAMIISATLTVLYLGVFRAQPQWIAILGLCCFLVAVGLAIQNEIANMCGASLRPDDQTALISRAHPTFVVDAEHRLAVLSAI